VLRRLLPGEPDEGFVLKPIGAADTYDVTLFGKGDGDLEVTFRSTTPGDGPPGNLRSIKECSPLLRSPNVRGGE